MEKPGLTVDTAELDETASGGDSFVLRAISRLVIVRHGFPVSLVAQN